ncbi:DNA2 [Lepeophtheirus salmonis]|uniref:DNA replication ATP-dependent helicase/nuclease n=1 Tax=Lepeophtheirus salmonis TaxID=72036 RepID=A0A7R8H4U2_LEPSM|nr:DNA2 [Lepeophtheirus salmonis]CAF2865965.1 DNA2 [Lepeophtheirus salmonis]
MPHILFFIERYVKEEKNVKPPEQAFAPISRKAPSLPPSKWPGSVERKVDLTLKVKLKTRDKRGRLNKIMPLELKTGRPSGSAEHRGQVIMYSMIMSERRDDPESGLLLYLRNSSLMEVNAGIHEMRGLVQLRNQLVSHLLNLNYKDLPEPINLKTACEKCPHLIACTASIGDQNFGESHAMHVLIPDSLKHLTKEELNFFDRWNKMISFETYENRSSSRQKDLWLKLPEERKKNNQALDNLTLIRENDMKHSFRGDMANLSNPPFAIGETILVSTKNAIALAQGTVYRIGTEVIEVILDRNLYKDQEWKNCIFCIDKYEYVPSSAALVNLAKLMSDTEESKKLRSLIIDKRQVEFLQGLPKEVAINAKPILKTLNRVQQKAIFKTLMAKDNICLKGMPGTGKTTLIVALIRLLAMTMKKSVLLTSYTNTAVDNEDAPGSTPGFYNHMFESQTEFEDKLVVGTTCLGLNHPAITSRRFDYCILDEAGQASLLSSVGPLFHAKVFILVGDPEQLRPVVRSVQARSLGMSESIFSLMERENNVIPLTLQYRMNSRITECANFLTYKGELECGNTQVASNILKEDHSHDSDPSWVKSALDPSLHQSIVFLDTGSRGVESRHGSYGITNTHECEIIEQLFK